MLCIGYAANAADILELFESFNSPKIIYDTNVTICVLATYTWALLQFALITTATPGRWKKRHQPRGNGANNGQCEGDKGNCECVIG